VAAGPADQQLGIGRAENLLVVPGVEVVFVLAHELDQLRFTHPGAVILGGVLVVIAECHRPLDAPGLHGQHHVVHGLLDLAVGARGTVDHVPVDQHELGLLPVQHLVHELDGAPVGARAVLGVVELDDLEPAVAPEGEGHPAVTVAVLGHKRRCRVGGRRRGGEHTGSRDGAASGDQVPARGM